MEKIQRRLLMLKPTDGFSGCKDGTALRLQTENSGVSAMLSATGLSDDVYDAYLLMSSGEYHLAGQITEGTLGADVPNIALSDIIGAAVVHTQNEHPAFCLVSTGIDWQDAAARFKIAHMHDRSHNNAHPQISQEPAAQPSLADRSDEAPPLPTPAQIHTPETPHAVPAELTSQNEASQCDACPQSARQRRINPFPSVFPGAEWIKVSYPGPTGWWHYITGTVDCASVQGASENGRIAKVIGVPGDYGMSPPVWLSGFSTYLHSTSEDARGYWLLFQDAQTGDVLSMDLSRRGG